MERVAIDLMGPLPKTDSDNQWILVVGDYHTKWMEAYALPDAKAVTVARKLVEEFISRFGVPTELHSDQGSNFESQVFSEVCNLLKINKTRTTPYNPKSDGLVERFNKTLMNMVAMMLHETEGKKNWDEHLALATSAYRATPQESTGETPNMMMFGRETKLPVDLTTASLDDEKSDEEEDYAYQLRTRIRGAHKRAEECLGKSAVRQKTAYNRKSNDHKLQVGDFVWLHDPAKKKGVSPKLQLRWKGPFLIVSKLSDVTMRIQMSPRAKPMVVHVDRLKPCHGVQQEKWEWRKPSDPQVKGGIEEGNENHPDEMNEAEETSNRPTDELVDSDVLPEPHEDSEREENPNPFDSHEPSFTESGSNTSSQDDKDKGVEGNNALKRSTRYPLRTRARPKYLDQYHT